MGLSGHCSSVNAVSQHPATPLDPPPSVLRKPPTEAALPHQLSNERKSCFRSACNNTDDNLLDHLCRFWRQTKPWLRAACGIITSFGARFAFGTIREVEGSSVPLQTASSRDLKVCVCGFCWITLRWMKSRWCFETSQKRRSRIPSRGFLIGMRQWLIYPV